MKIQTRSKAPAFPSLNIKSAVDKLGSSFFGPSSSIFVGRFGYPDVLIGPMASIDYSKAQDDPSQWFGKGYYDIIKLRSSLLRSKHKHSVHNISRFIENNQELALAAKPADIEMDFSGKPNYRMSMSSFVQPMGPSVDIEKLKLAENVKIGRKVDKIVNDDLKAVEAAFSLYKTGEDVYKITTILSSGALGLNKKLVPTRWSITASDDLIGKNLIEKIREHPKEEEYIVYERSYMGNHFTILMMPGSWEFENFEAWSPGSNWSFSDDIEISEEYEPFTGRSDYATAQVGGYYASRLGVAESLVKRKKQCKAVVFREISSEYSIPLGVWVVRETVRRAFDKEPKRFETREGMMNYVRALNNIPMEEYIKRSRILQQKSVQDFL
jgi:DNA repair protein NreA